MGRRRPFTELSLLIAVAIGSQACAPRTPHTDVGIPGVIGAPPGVVTGSEHVETVSVDPAAAGRVRGLGQQLADQDQRIAAMRGEIAAARADQAAAATAPRGVDVNPAAPAPPQPPAPLAPASVSPPPPQPQPQPVQALSGSITGERPATVPEAAASSPAASEGTIGAAGASAPLARSAAPAGSPDPRLAEAQRRIARLERMLAAEEKRRREVEDEMDRLLQETSAGPFEQQDAGVVEKHLREQLDRARREVSNLRNTIAGERRSRDELERRFAALQAQLQAAPAGDAPPSANREELEALKERQRRVLASIQQDLAATKQREAELRQTLQGAEGVALAETVSGLRIENSALQMRLDEEHRRNAELNAKLQLAQKVTDLIFRMQNSAAQPVPAAAR